jgi:hypothetical protein
VVEEMRDEHVPVFGNFQVEVEKVNEEVKEAVSEEVFNRVSHGKALIDDEEGT